MTDAENPVIPAGTASRGKEFSHAADAALVLAGGEVFWGRGAGAVGKAVGEVCFNTSITGYQEILTDPSYAGQIITFTFPHIGNVGTNDEDVEADNPYALGCIVRQDVTEPSNFRNVAPFDEWMAAHGRVGLSGVDTRALTRMIREKGAPNIVIAHDPDGAFDIAALAQKAASWPGLEGMDLAIEVTGKESRLWKDGVWRLGFGYGAGEATDERPHVVAIDYGAKNNIFRNLVKAGARVTVLPATATYEQVIAQKPDGVFLSNGPGDLAATGAYAVPVIAALLADDIPVFGICLGHQLLALAVGAKTIKMHQGHRGANHPVKRLSDGLVEITSMNHGFAVDTDSLRGTAVLTHVNLNDDTVEGLRHERLPLFSVQYHPEASPGPRESAYLFKRFVDMLEGTGTRV